MDFPSERSLSFSKEGDKFNLFGKLKDILNKTIVGLPPSSVYLDDNCDVYLSISTFHDSFVEGGLPFLSYILCTSITPGPSGRRLN